VCACVLCVCVCVCVCGGVAVCVSGHGIVEREHFLYRENPFYKRTHSHTENTFYDACAAVCWCLYLDKG